jgi:hypothetical protein
MTALDIHHKMPDVPLPLIRGLLQTMLHRGLAHRIGDTRPYSYKVGRGAETHNRGKDLNITAVVRECIKAHGPISAKRIVEETGVSIQEVRARITEMKKRKFIAVDENGLFTFLRDRITPSQRMSDEKRKEIDRNRMRLARQKEALRRSQVISVKPKVAFKFAGPAQTVEEWLASGGVIDRSPTQSRFEHLTTEEIMSRSGVAMGFQMPKSPRLSPEGKW